MDARTALQEMQKAIRLPRPGDKAKTIKPVHPNVGIEARYRRELERLVYDLQTSIIYWIRKTYEANPPEIALDESPAREMQTVMSRLASQWRRRLDRLSVEMATHFATEAADRSDTGLAASLRKSGLAISFRMTPAAHDVIQATIGENISLIKSIAAEHLSDVEGDVMRSIAAGRDLGTLSRSLRQRYDLTKKRAALIARDQNNKATASMTYVRQRELGIKRARWVHSHAGKQPRPDHVAFAAGKLGGPFYDVEKGALISGQWIRPGQLINCRCVSVSVVPGFE